MLICSDGSPAADRAIRLGAAVAAACQTEVTLLGIAEVPGTSEALLDSLRRGQQLLMEKKLHTTLVAKTGDPIEEIVRQTEEITYDLVVIGAAHKESRGLFWRSSKTYKIIKSIDPPVLAVMESHPSIKRILICTGGKKYIDNAVALTGRIAQCMGASVTLFHVSPAPPALYSRLYHREADATAILNSRSELGRNLRKEKATLESFNVPTNLRLRQGLVLDEIFKEMQSGGYDLVVCGSSLSRGGLHTYVLGDITREIVNRATCAVLVARAAGKSEALTSSLRAWLGRVIHRGRAVNTTDTR